MDKNFSRFKLATSLRIVITLLILLFLPECIFAAPPFISDDAAVTTRQHFQFYLYSSAVNGSGTTFLSLPALEMDYGFIKNGEVDLTVQILTYLPSQGKSATGLGDTQAKIKYVVMEESHNRPQIAIEPTLELPTGNAQRNLGYGKSWYQLPLWIEKRWGSWTTYGGGGYVINLAKDAKNYSFAGWVLQRNFTEALALGLEIYSQGASSKSFVPLSNSFTLVDIGTNYNFNSSTALLLSVGHSICGMQLWYGYLGINLQM